MGRKRVHRRVWLQPSNPDVHSYVSYTIGSGGWMDLRVASCERNADFSFGSQGGADLRKLDKMIATLQEARDVYAERIS